MAAFEQPENYFSCFLLKNIIKNEQIIIATQYTASKILNISLLAKFIPVVSKPTKKIANTASVRMMRIRPVSFCIMYTPLIGREVRQYAHLAFIWLIGKVP
jgi:hypothetical protein